MILYQVSRVGMVFMSSSILPWKPIFEAWLKKRPNQREVLEASFDAIYSDVQTYVQTKLNPKMFLLEAIYIRQTLDILEGLLMDVEIPNDGKKKSKLFLERLFLFSVMWSLGALLELEERQKLQIFVTEHPSKLSWPKCGQDETIFEFFVGTTGDWCHWLQRVDEFLYPDDRVLEYSSILVPNVDNIRTAFLIDTAAKQNKGVLLIGEQGIFSVVLQLFCIFLHSLAL